MIFAEMGYQKHYSDFHVDPVAFVAGAFSQVQCMKNLYSKRMRMPDSASLPDAEPHSTKWTPGRSDGHS